MIKHRSQNNDSLTVLCGHVGMYKLVGMYTRQAAREHTEKVNTLQQVKNKVYIFTYT